MAADAVAAFPVLDSEIWDALDEFASASARLSSASLARDKHINATLAQITAAGDSPHWTLGYSPTVGGTLLRSTRAELATETVILLIPFWRALAERQLAAQADMRRYAGNRLPRPSEDQKDEAT